MKEREFQSAVIEAARRNGWRVAHFRTSRTSSGGWATAVQADGAGFPDLVLVHAKAGMLKFREIKTDTGRASKEQLRWLSDLHAAGQDTGIWRPMDWPLIERELAAARRAA